MIRRHAAIPASLLTASLGKRAALAAAAAALLWLTISWALN
jgi:hypothetical protein